MAGSTANVANLAAIMIFMQRTHNTATTKRSQELTDRENGIITDMVLEAHAPSQKHKHARSHDNVNVCMSLFIHELYNLI